MARGRRPRPVYLFPVRIQQGWGDVQELAVAAWALERSGEFDLLYLTGGSSGATRGDRRAEPVDPHDAGPIDFPPVRVVRRPLGRGPAAVLATWYGTTGRRHDAEGGPLPGTIEDRVERVRAAHGPRSTLVVSLEEFASDQPSSEVLDEGMRQAGWSSARRQRQLASPEGARERALYHRAFGLARGAEREDVLHLVATFRPDPRARREFPFLVPVGPVRPRAPPVPGPRRRPRREGRRALVVWYASPASSPAFAGRLLPALARTGVPLDLWVRGCPGAVGTGTGSPTTVRVRELPPSERARWSATWRRADLRIASGSQSLVEAATLGAPMLYFNGLVQGPGEPPRGFRREKLLSLLRGLRAAGAPSQVLRDLEDFADGRNLERVVRRALGSFRWKEEESTALGRLPMGFPRSRREGGGFVVGTLRSFFAHEGDVGGFVRQVRRRAAAEPAEGRSGGPVS